MQAITTGEQLKRQGQALADNNAGYIWAEVAMSHLRQFLNERKASGDTTPFTFDEFRQWAMDRHMGEPVSVNAWGSLPKKAVAAGLCTPTGQFAKAGRVAAHARMLRLWRAV